LLCAAIGWILQEGGAATVSRISARKELDLVALSQRTETSTSSALGDVAATGVPAAERGGKHSAAPDGGGVSGEASPHQPQSAGGLVDAGAGEELVAALGLSEEFGGGRLLVSDVRVAFLLINRARHLAIARLFGVPRDQANLVTLIAVMVLAERAHEKAHRLIGGPSLPSAGDGLLAGASLRELLCGFAGAPARDTPLLGTLLTIAVLGGTVGPTASKSLRAVGTSSHRVAVGFHDRYGYIIDPGHWRQRRAQRRS
jgi:hypothetical protein